MTGSRLTKLWIGIAMAGVLAASSQLMLLTDATAQDATPAPAAAAVPAADPATVAAALELMEVTGASKTFDNLTSMMRTHVSAGASAGPAGASEQATKIFDEMMVKFAAYKPQMMNETAALYAQRFTAAELKTIADFYRSGTGAKFISEMPELMKEGGAIGQKYAMKMMQEYKDAKK